MAGRRDATRDDKSGPRRTCIGCREVRPRRELVRLVRTTDGVVRADRRGSGRGAYVCADPRCLERLLKPGRLAQAFRKPAKASSDLAQEVRESWQQQK